MATKYDDKVREISQSARICWTCGGTPNPNNFGGLCDPCEADRSARLDRAAEILIAHGQEHNDLGRAIKGRVAAARQRLA